MKKSIILLEAPARLRLFFSLSTACIRSDISAVTHTQTPGTV